MIKGIILAGGSGTRLWPLSRKLMPKQFVRMFEGRSLFQQTIERNQSLCSKLMVVSNQDQYFLAIDQLEGVLKNTDDLNFLIEPIGKNSAPAIALACFDMDPEEVALVVPSDHLIRNVSAYNEAVNNAFLLAKEGGLVTFGIKPDKPETGYGYIEVEGSRVLSFNEKPTLDVAQSYLKKSNYLWNSGMFCFQAGVYLEELKKFNGEIFERSKLAYDSAQRNSEDSLQILMEHMQLIPDESIDYAVMEHSDAVKVVVCDMGWSDVGSFDSLKEVIDNDSSSNSNLKQSADDPEPICINSKNNLIVSDTRHISLLDIEDTLIVDTSDALMISKIGSSQGIKGLVTLIKQSIPELTEIHQKAHRPWGSYEILAVGTGYKVKRIVVKTSGRLSLQKHRYRNEHWVVVSGKATVTVGEDIFIVYPNESTYIKMGQLHRLENHESEDLVMIEVQVGEYTGEDDIERVEDKYGR